MEILMFIFFFFLLASIDGTETTDIREEIIVTYSQPEVTFTPHNQLPPESRLEMLSKAAGIDVPISIGQCEGSERVTACYSVANKTITVTELGMSQDDDRLLCTLKHENRHVYQDRNNMINYVNEYVSNREYLEWDARQASGCSDE
jgi:hypothetical protein